MSAALRLAGHAKDLGGGFKVRRLLPAVQRQAVEVFGAPATDAQRGLVGGGSAHALSDRGEGEVHPCIVAAAVCGTAGGAREFFEQRL